MADKAIENVEGPYYVTDECIACGLCIGTADENIKYNDDESCAFVFKQPENDEEISSCEEALSDCPVEAIQNDG